MINLPKKSSIFMICHMCVQACTFTHTHMLLSKSPSPESIFSVMYLYFSKNIMTYLISILKVTMNVASIVSHDWRICRSC